MVRLATAATALAAVLLLAGASSAVAAFPGKPGPIAFRFLDEEEILPEPGDVGSSLEVSGGLFAHGPRQGQKSRPLSGELRHHSPSYSPDGRLIVFVVRRDDPALPFTVEASGAIFVMRADGAELRQLTDSESDSHPSFFPDGRRIVFERGAGAHSHIFSLRLDGAGLRQLTDGPHRDAEPVVSPNGRRIAFVSDRDRDGRRDRSDIFVIRPGGSVPRVLIDGASTSERQPEYAPFGNRIAFATVGVFADGRESFDEGGTIYTARPNGRRVRPLFPCRARRCPSHGSPSFSPNGRHVAFLDLTGGVAPGSDLKVARSDGRGRAKTFAAAGRGREGFGSTIGAPSWGVRPGR